VTHQEVAWWNDLEGDQVHINTAGHPPYQLQPVVDRIVDTLDIPHWVDLGCGVGRLTNAVAERTYPYCKIVGIDPAPQLIVEAQRTAAPGARYLISDGYHLPPLPIHPISGIYSVTVFQHIPYGHKLNYVREALELLLPLGKFLFTVSVGDEPDVFLNHQIPESRLDDFCEWIMTLADSVAVDMKDENGWTWIEVTK
jgi:SAM-dependent methyltransferase